jgi:hypothetical protein
MKIKTLACFFLLLLAIPGLAMGTGAIQVVNKATITDFHPTVKIWLNDEYQGEVQKAGGLYIDGLQPGGYRLEARSPGFESQQKNLSIRDGEVVVLTLDFSFPRMAVEEIVSEQDIIMSQKVGSVIFRSVPIRAYIYLDGKRIGQANKRIKNVSSGFHTVGFAFPKASVSGSFELQSNEVLLVTGLLQENQVVTSVMVPAIPEKVIGQVEEVDILSVSGTNWQGSECNDYGDCWKFTLRFNQDGTVEGDGGILPGTTWVQNQNIVDLMSMETGEAQRVGRLNIVDNSILEGWEKNRTRTVYLELVDHGNQ